MVLAELQYHRSKSLLPSIHPELYLILSCFSSFCLYNFDTDVNQSVIKHSLNSEGPHPLEQILCRIFSPKCSIHPLQQFWRLRYFRASRRVSASESQPASNKWKTAWQFILRKICLDKILPPPPTHHQWCPASGVPSAAAVLLCFHSSPPIVLLLPCPFIPKPWFRRGKNFYRTLCTFFFSKCIDCISSSLLQLTSLLLMQNSH